jgi:hypothetical protein
MKSVRWLRLKSFQSPCGKSNRKGSGVSVWRSLKDIMRRNAAREGSTTRQSVPWGATSAVSSTKCSRTNASTGFALKKGIPRRRSGRDRR